MVNITELNKLIYAGAKLFNDEIGLSQRNPSRNTKPERERRVGGQIKKLRQQAELLRKIVQTKTQRNENIL